MAVLSTVRRVVFLVLLLTAAMVPTGPVRASEEACEGYEWCEYCDAGSRCVIGLGESCESYPGCSYAGICSGTGGPGGNICTCEPCP